MFLGSFAEYCIVSDQRAIPVPKQLPFDRACLIGCGVMMGVGAALILGAIAHGDSVMVIGCGAVALAVQGARLPERTRSSRRLRPGKTQACNADGPDLRQ